MLINPGLRTLAQRLCTNWFGTLGGKRRTVRRHTIPLGLETLESRELLTTFTVTTALDDVTDDSVVSLREAIDAANASSGADLISFSSDLAGQRFLLTQGPLFISDPLTINGLGATNTVIDAQLNSRVFSLTQTAGDVTFDGLTVTGGRTDIDGYRGAGIYSYSAGNFTLSNSTVTGNATFGALSPGGGIFSFLGPVSLINSTVSGNSTSGDSAPGGGIATNSAPITLVNSTISGNFTQGTNSSGAGVATYSGNIKLTNTTVAFNSATGSFAGGGGLFSGATRSQATSRITLNNSIVAKNTTTRSTAADFFQGTGVTSLSVNNSLIGINTGTTLSSAPLGSPDSSGNLIGTSANPIDPKLGTLALNGGTTKTHTLLNGSPAVDAGDNALAVGLNNAALTQDQNGQARILHSVVDMGSTEGVNAASGPTVSFSASSRTVSESTGVVTLTVNLSAPVSQSVTIPFTVSGTASNGADYTIASSPLVIPANATSGSIQISIVDDVLTENNESIIVTLGTPTNAALGSPATQTVNIAANDNGTGSGGPTDINLSANTVAENVANAFVGGLTAIDPDAGDTPTFSIQPGNQGNQFTISGNQLRVAATGLNYEALTDGVALVTIRATDSSGLFLDKTFSVNVTNVNEVPVIPAGQAFSVPEGATQGTIAGTVTATDPDSIAPNNTLTYSIFSGNTGNAFAIDAASGQITVADPSALNSTTNSRFNLLIKVADGGSPALSSTQFVRIDVGNVNHAPTIPTGQNFTIADNVANNFVVGTVIATDPDLSAPNKTLTYGILSGNANNAFSINSTTGVITVNDASVLDGTTRPQYTLLVRVFDGGSPALSDTASVVVRVTSTSTSNHLPIIPANQTFNVPENSAVNTVVGTVIASDPDATAPNNTLTYRITGGNGSNAFAIDSSTGQITVLRPSVLNYETASQYTLQIRVTDGGNPSLSATRSVRVNLIDVNEAPSIPANQRLTVADQPPINTIVGTVIATDPDLSTTNKTLTYAITGGNTDDAFAINAASGQITVNNPTALNSSTNPSFNLVIRVTDGGGLTASQVVRVDLTGPNQAPVLTNSGSPPVYERHGNNSVLVLPNISVSDPDRPTDLAQVTFSVSLPSGRRNLDRINLSSLAGLGTVSEKLVGGRYQITVMLRTGTTTEQVQNALRSITFSTKGIGLNDATRNVQVQVTDRQGATSGVVTQEITVNRRRR